MRWRLLLVLLFAAAGAGCASLSDAASGMRQKLGPRDEPRERAFAAAPRLTYEAVRAAASQMGYRFVRGGPAQGEFEAVTAVGEGERSGTSRQLSMKVRLRSPLDGKGTDLTLRISEIIEPDSTHRLGRATELPLRDSPQYEVFFRRVQQALGAAEPKG